MDDQEQQGGRERRRFTRVLFSRAVKLEFNDNRYEHCQLRDLSIGGMYVEGAFDQKVGDECLAYLYESGATFSMMLKFMARVVHRTNEGIGLEFTVIDYESFQFLQTMILYYADNQADVVEEFPEDLPFEIKDND